MAFPIQLQPQLHLDYSSVFVQVWTILWLIFTILWLIGCLCFFFFCCRTSTQKLELDLHTFRRQFKPRHTPVLTSPVRRMNVDTVASVWPVQVHLSDVVAVADMIMVTERTEPLRRCFLIPYDSERGKKHRRQIRGKEAQTPSAYK